MLRQSNHNMDETYLTCVYCGKPNIHPERLFRYCPSDACIKDGQAMVFPKYPTTAVLDNAAEVMERNSTLSQALEDALQTIEQQKQDIDKHKNTIIDLVSNRRTALDSEIEVARWDLLRLLVQHHQGLENGIEVANGNQSSLLDVLNQAYNILTHQLTKLGIERIGQVGEEVAVYHYLHDSWSPHGALARVVRPGYYSSKADYVVHKAVVIGKEDVYPWSKDEK